MSNNNLTVIEWTYKLQHELDKMNAEELNVYLKNKAIRYEGKLYTIGESDEKCEGKDDKTNRKTSSSSKRDTKNTKNVEPNIN